MDGLEDLLSEFITDTQEALERADMRLVELENETDGTALLNELFRLMHTIKGTCGFLGLPRMASLAHAAESLMDRLRNGEPVTNEAVEVMLRVVDRLQQILAGIEASGGQEPEGSDDALVAQLNVSGQSDGGDAAAAEETGADGGDATAAMTPSNDDGPDEPAAAHDATKTARPPAPATAPEASQTPANAAPREDKSEATSEGERSIRVSVETLEHLMTVVSELVLTRNELTEIMRTQDGANNKLALQRLSTVTGELQQAVMSTRMQPIGNAFRKLPRIVRDVSAALGKQIELETLGASTELDRQVLESIKDPLVHMVRNAADHGLEMPEDRIAAGKPEKGRITINAYHEGGQILVEIADDGRGLNVEKIKEKAIARGITTAQDAERLTNEQIYPFIFAPGFSTATNVTAVSGRGVGMDVVQSNIERIGGFIDVRSVQGEGSVFTLKIPLTLAILRALIVGVDDHEFAIPQNSVDELLRVEPGGPHSIKMIKDAPVLSSRNRLLPVVDLRSVLQLPPVLDDNGVPHKTDDTTEGFVMVIRARGLSFGVLVDTVLRTEEIVVKPMPATLRNLEIFSGSTILGDGRVIMIVDPNGVRSAATHPNDVALQPIAGATEEAEPTEDAELVLVFRAGSRNRKALPVDLITRLEEINLSEADQSDGQWLIRYNDELIPLVWVEEPMDVDLDQRKPLLVMSDNGRSMALVVDEIVDIVNDSLKVQIPSERPGILGNAVIGGSTAEVIDVSYFLGLASVHWFDPLSKKRQGVQPVLLVDDSAFFRSLVAPAVRSAGFNPIVCGSGAEALELLEGGIAPSVIVTDVDMPEMDGFAFARAVRKIERLRSTPIIALSGVVADEAIGEARAAGFADYVSKLDRHGLIAALHEFTKPESEEIAA